MADNDINVFGGGTFSVATDDIGSVHYQRVKTSWGVNGAATDTSYTDPLPVTHIFDSASSTYGNMSAIATSTATAVPASALSGRRCLWVYNDSDTLYYLGLDNTVTASKYFLKLLPGGVFFEPFGPNLILWVFQNSGSNKSVAYAEFK